jgi:S-DNA-T family DNA segregation ATPase FtsK/SpoIIIE
MATTAKKSKKTMQPPAQASDLAAMSIDRKRQVRLGFGIFFLLSGVFICFSIISYCFTWKIDQSNLRRNNGISGFLFHHDQTAVANWGGRMGAALSDLLVYRGAGIASLAIGIAIAGLGLSLIYGKKVLPLLRYLRWLSTALILLAPVLSFIFPHSEFRLGGTLGKNTIEYLNGLIGSLGTGMLLLSTVAFFVFVIFALDIRPFLNRMRQRARNMAASLGPEPAFNAPAEAESTEEEEGEEKVLVEEKVPALAMAGEMPTDEEPPFAIGNERKQWDMTLEEREGEPGELEESETEEEPEEEESNAEYEAYQKYLAEKNSEPEVEEKADADPEFSFEVIMQEEKPAIQHGAHISIASNEPYAPELDLPDYKFPTLDLLEERATEP